MLEDQVVVEGRSETEAQVNVEGGVRTKVLWRVGVRLRHELM